MQKALKLCLVLAGCLLLPGCQSEPAEEPAEELAPDTVATAPTIPGGHRRHLGHAFGSHERARHDRHNLPDRGDARGNDHLPPDRDPVQAVVVVSGDSIIADAGPFESVTRWRHGLDAFRVQARRGPPRR